MLSPSRRLIVPLFVYLSLLLATAVDAHDVPLHLRDSHMKRIMKKRSPFPDGEPVVPTPVAGAAGIPTLPTSSPSVASSAAVSSTNSASSTTATGSSSTGTVSSTSSSVSSTASTTSSTTSASSTQTSATSTLTTSAAASSVSLNVIGAPVPSTSTIVQPNVTRTQAIAQSAPTDSQAASVSGAAASDSGKSTILTVLIAVAASVGGVAILWTVFRKWKLSSSKKFDERLRPIDWQQPTADDGAIPTHRRHSGASSFRSAPGHSDAGSRAHDPLDHDFTAGASTVGGYADLARGPAMPPMTENITRGPSFNRPFDNTVPLHHQGYGGARY